MRGPEIFDVPCPLIGYATIRLSTLLRQGERVEHTHATLNICQGSFDAVYVAAQV